MQKLLKAVEQGLARNARPAALSAAAPSSSSDMTQQGVGSMPVTMEADPGPWRTRASI
jgi:hypothetical protein